MQNYKPLELITRISSEAEIIEYKESARMENLLKRLESLLSKIFGQNTKYIEDLNDIKFKSDSPLFSTGLFAESIWKNAKEKLLNLLTIIKEDLELSIFDIPASQNSTIEVTTALNPNIFIVHGHNEEMKQSVARLLEKLSLTPIILHEQANKGRTIIEKFTDHSNVSYAVILLSADDIGVLKTQKLRDGKLRARQNVIFELGFFIGKLGRQKVFTLFEQTDGFEFPSDYTGVIFTPFDNQERWKYDLVKELKVNGFNIDANKII